MKAYIVRDADGPFALAWAERPADLPAFLAEYGDVSAMEFAELGAGVVRINDQVEPNSTFQNALSHCEALKWRKVGAGTPAVPRRDVVPSDMPLFNDSPEPPRRRVRTSASRRKAR